MRFELKSFETSSLDGKKSVLYAGLEFLIASNLAYLENHAAPLLYQAGIAYTPDDALVDEKWKDIPQVLFTNAGNCKEFAAWRVAELRKAGDLLARPIVMHTDIGGNQLFHILVRRGDGHIEDPSRALGMREPT